MLFVSTWAVLRLAVCWKALQATLVNLAETPLAWSLTSLPPAIKRSVRPSLINLANRHPLGPSANTQWYELAHVTRAVPSSPSLSSADSRITALTMDKRWWTPHRPAADMGDRLAEVQDVLSQLWTEEPLRVAWNPKDLEAQKKYFNWSHPDSIKAWRRNAEEFMAGQVVYYISWAQDQLRRIAYFLLISLVISVALVSSYPFQPQSIVKALLAILIVVATGTIIYVTGQMNRDPVLSALSDTDPGVITWNRDFMLNVFLYVVVPILTLLSSEVPGIRSVVFSWAAPLVKSLAKF
jgi:hypothetical protein